MTRSDNYHVDKLDTNSINRILFSGSERAGDISDELRLRLISHLSIEELPPSAIRTYISGFSDIEKIMDGLDLVYEHQEGRILKDLISCLPNDSLKQLLTTVSNDDLVAYIVEQLRTDQKWLVTKYFEDPRIRKHAVWQIDNLGQLIAQHVDQGEMDQLAMIELVIGTKADGEIGGIDTKFTKQYLDFFLKYSTKYECILNHVISQVQDDDQLFDLYLDDRIGFSDIIKLTIINNISNSIHLYRLMLFENNNYLRQEIKQVLRSGNTISNE